MLCLQRWLFEKYDETTIDTLPEITEEWLEIGVETCMFPIWMQDRGINGWERQYCPWWMDYPLGEYPKYEALHYKGTLSHLQKSFNISLIK